jgi:hypothetical protein
LQLSIIKKSKSALRCAKKLGSSADDSFQKKKREKKQLSKSSSVKKETKLLTIGKKLESSFKLIS